VERRSRLRPPQTAVLLLTPTNLPVAPFPPQAARLESVRLRQLHPYTPAAARQGWHGWAGYSQLMSPQVGGSGAAG
jgi:hypothetical protein